MYTVYKHTTPSGKVYIGITSQKPEERWRGGKGYTHSPHFENAIKKYGWESIRHEILYENLSKEEAEAKEVNLIKIYESTNPKKGYNCDSGGNVQKCHSQETREKIRNAHIGMRYDAAFGEKQSVLKKGNKNSLGHKVSEETRRLISQKNKGRFAGEKNYFFGKRFCGKDNKNSKAVSKYDLDGNFIESRESAEAFAKEMGKHKGTHITEVCRGKRKTAYGFIWRFGNGAQKNGII